MQCNIALENSSACTEKCWNVHCSVYSL